MASVYDEMNSYWGVFYVNRFTAVSYQRSPYIDGQLIGVLSTSTDYRFSESWLLQVIFTLASTLRAFY